eukprot:1339275-Rhodomonas_salina.1
MVLDRSGTEIGYGARPQQRRGAKNDLKSLCRTRRSDARPGYAQREIVTHSLGYARRDSDMGLGCRTSGSAQNMRQ